MYAPQQRYKKVHIYTHTHTFTMDVLQASLQDAVTQVLEKSAPFDEQLGVPSGTTATISTCLVLFISVIWCLCACCCRAKSTKKSTKAIKSTVLFVGPANSGKTTMVHQVSLFIEGCFDCVAEKNKNEKKKKSLYMSVDFFFFSNKICMAST